MKRVIVSSKVVRASQESPIEKVEMNVSGQFWTRQNEMVEDLEDLGYDVVEINWEYVTVVDTYDDNEPEYILYLGHANSTMWVERVRAMN